MTAQAPSSGRSERIEIGGGKPGAPSLVLTGVNADFADKLGRSFAAIDPWARYPYPANALTNYFEGNEANAPRYAVYSDGILAGALGLRHNWLRGPYIQFLGLLPGYQRSGTGWRLLNWCEQEAHSSFARNLWVAASDFNTDAIRFYERFGFVRAAELDGLVRDDRAEVLFRKRLF